MKRYLLLLTLILLPKELAEVRDLLIETKKRSLGFEVPTALQNRVLSRSASVTIAFSGVPTNVVRDPDTYYFTPREGSYFGADNLAIPAKALHVPAPDETVFEERWATGDWFRSGSVWNLGQGRIFYFRPGHESYPVYHEKTCLKILENAVRWLGTKGRATN